MLPSGHLDNHKTTFQSIACPSDELWYAGSDFTYDTLVGQQMAPRAGCIIA